MVSEKNTMPMKSYTIPRKPKLMEQIPAIRKKSSATITQPVEKKARGNIESIPIQQMYQQLNYARNVQNPGHPNQNMNNSAAQNLFNLAHRVHPGQYAQAHRIPTKATHQSPKVLVNQITYTQDSRAEYVQPLLQTQRLLYENQIPPAPRNGSAVRNQPASNLEALLIHDLPKHQNQLIENVQVTEKEPHTLTGFLNQKEILRKLQLAKLNVSSIKVDEFLPEITQNSVLETTNELEEMQSEVRSPEETVQQSEAEKLDDDQIFGVELTENYGDKVTMPIKSYTIPRKPKLMVRRPQPTSHSSFLGSHLQQLPEGKPANNIYNNISYDDISCVEMLTKSVLTPELYSPNAINFSAQRQIPAIRKKSSATITQPVVEKKARGNIESIPIQQMYQQLNYARNVQNPGHPNQNMNNSAAQNLLNLAHRVHPGQYVQAHRIPTKGTRQSLKVPVNQKTYTQDSSAEYVQPLLQTQRPLNENQIPTPRNGSAVRNQPASNLEALLIHDLPKHQNQLIENVQTGFLNQKDILGKLQLAKLNVSSIKVDEFLPEITQNSVLETTNELEEMQSEVRSPEETVQQSEAEKLNDDQIFGVELTENYGDKVTSRESGYETDRHQSKDLQAPVSDDEIMEASTDDSYYPEDGIRSEEDASTITEEESMDAQNLISESSENLSKESALKMLEAHGLMLTKLYRNFLKTEDYYNYLRMTTLQCLRLYRVMKKCVVEDDKESCPDPALKEKALEVVEEPAEELTSEPTEEPIEEPAPVPSRAVKKIPNGIQNKGSNSKIKKTKKDDKKQKLVLPPEYDPKDSKWTLRYNWS